MKNKVKKSVKKVDPSKPIKPVKKVVLPEVTVTASRIRKPIEEKVKLFPKGVVAKRSVDSLKRVGLSKAIGEPIKIKGQISAYGPASSDVIKKALKKK